MAGLLAAIDTLHRDLPENRALPSQTVLTIAMLSRSVGRQHPWQVDAYARSVPTPICTG